jgi:hypothetical protein
MAKYDRDLWITRIFVSERQIFWIALITGIYGLPGFCMQKIFDAFYKHNKARLFMARLRWFI